MNALSWFKEWARRSQTADVMSGVREAARANLAGTTNTLVRQGEEREALDTQIAGRVQLEGIQQAGLTERETIQERIEAAKSAAAAIKDRAAQDNTNFDNASRLEGEAAVRQFGKVQGMSESQIEALVLSEKAKAAKVAPKEDPLLNDTVQLFNRADTVAGLDAAVAALPENIRSNPIVVAALRISQANAAAKERESRDVRNKRWAKDEPTPDKPKVMTVSEYNSAGERVAELEAKLSNPRLKISDQGRKDFETQIAFLRRKMSEVSAQSQPGSASVSGKGKPGADVRTQKLIDWLSSQDKKK